MKGRTYLLGACARLVLKAEEKKKHAEREMVVEENVIYPRCILISVSQNMKTRMG